MRARHADTRRTHSRRDALALTMRGPRPLRLMMGMMILLPAALPAHAQAAPDLLAHIEGLKCVREDHSVRVAYKVEGAIGPEIRTTLESGLPVTFTHKLSVVRRRALFFDRTLARARVEATVRLDTLTKQYAMTREIDGHRVESATADSFERAQTWLTEVRGIIIELPKDAWSGTLELRVKTEYEKNYYVLWVLPWSLSALDEKECH